MSQKMKIKISNAQCNALNEIRGLQQDAHYMVILAKKLGDGYVLEGSEETFDHLVADLYDEVEFAMQPKSSLKQLQSLICKIQPDGDF
jgi:hypothetical protein